MNFSSATLRRPFLAQAAKMASKGMRRFLCSGLLGLLGFCLASVPFAEALGRAGDADQALAREIRADQTLKDVHRMALDLLRSGLNAGSGYREVWIRDLNTFIEVALEVNPPERLREALLTFFKFQGTNGDIVDGYVPLEQAQVKYAYRTSRLAPDLMAHKNTVETDQESSLVQAVRKYIRITGDEAFLQERVDGLSVRERLGRALQYVLTERFDRAHGLVWGATTADWGDVQPESPWGVALDANSHRTLDIYDNAMLLLALNDYVELLGRNSPEAARWKRSRDELKRNVRAHLWDANRRKFIPHIYLAGSPFPKNFDENAIYYFGGTAVAIQAGLLSREEVLDSLNQMVANVRAAGAASIGLTLYPPYPEGFFKNPQMREPYSYQNGGDWSWFGGRMIQALIQQGYVAEAYRELRPMVDRVKRVGGFYEWWSRDNQPRGSAQFRGSAGVLGRAIEMLQAWAQDIPIADFEGTNYGQWKTTGEAFGPGPAHGTLPNQMPVEGFQGKGLVNSYYGGDRSTGTLTSPEFKLKRKYITFLIGGGKAPGKTCMNLLIDGRIVRTATGPNDKPGGSETLAPDYWDVSEFAGKPAVIQIVDEATGGWGHINVDQLVETDRRPHGWLADVSCELTLEQRYLNLPVKNGVPKRRMSVAIEGQPPRTFEIELADQQPDWWAFMDIAPFKGKPAVLTVDKLPEDSMGLSAINQSDEIKDAAALYHEKLRPQFHFSARRGWLNDPNGLVFYKGEYHLFFQHNPYGWGWGNMHWGHAVSRDLVHWKELPIALYPDEHGAMFSGSAVVDWNNTAGFQTGQEKVLVCIFCAAGKPFTQGIAYSNDRGRTWTKYAHNPVLPHMVAENRDPKVIWYAPQKRWVMALYLDKNEYALFSSADLKHWQKMSDVTVPGTSECPEFFEIPLGGNRRDTRWIFYGGNGGYLIGRFDGRTFTPESGPHKLEQGNCFYASQTYSDIPPSDGRRILIPWGQINLPGMPFNQMMGLAVRLTLRTTEDGPRLFAYPVKEYASLHARIHKIRPQPLRPGENPLAGVNAELLDLTAELTPGSASEIGFNLRGIKVSYDVNHQELSCLDKRAALKPVGGRIRLRLLVDRASVDIFGNDGRLYMPMGVIVPQQNRSLELYAKGGSARLNSLEVDELKSAWGD